MNSFELADAPLELFIEALIFASEQSMNADEISRSLSVSFEQIISREDVEDSINKIVLKYDSEDFAIQLVQIGGGYCFMTKPSFHKIIGDFLKQSEKKKLSSAALETLSIIAYKQPISKSEIESIRGVNCDYTVQKLLEKDLIEIGGRMDTPGRPLIYITSEKFLNHFGLKDASDLPKLKEIESVENSIGELSEIDK